MFTSNGNLPNDVMIEILSRLPVTPLIRFRCVCKYWYALVNNHNFVSKHHKNYNVDNMRLIVCYNTRTEDYALSLFPDETLTELSHQDFLPQLPMSIHVVGYNDGLFCLFEARIGDYPRRLTLRNPAIRKFKTLPRSTTRYPRKVMYFNPFVGFGFDSINMDLKLVFVQQLYREDMLFRFQHVGVYTLSSNCWREFKTDGINDYYVSESTHCPFLNGIVYWLAFRDDIQEIISFNINNTDETFQVIQSPRQDPSPKILGIYNDSLSLLHIDYTENCFDIWVMKDKLWTKRLTIGPFIGVSEPLGFWKDIDAIFVASSIGQLLLYDPSSQEIRDLGLKCLYFLKTYSCKECLIMFNEEKSVFDAFDIPWNILGVYQTDIN